jgi:hypothetical protein
LILKKDSSENAKIHDLITFHRPISITPSDTLSVGLNGLIICGSAPVSSQFEGEKEQDVAESEEVDEWIQIKYISSTAKGSSSDDAYRTKVRKANIEISLSSKEEMNEWIDAILNQSEVISSRKH